MQDIADALKISKGSVNTIIKDHLKMKKLFSKWVPQFLTAEQKQQRVVDSKAGLELFEKNKKDFLIKYVTMDETWIHHYTPESRKASSEWIAAGETRPKRPKTQQSAGKVFASVFWDSHALGKSFLIRNFFKSNLNYQKLHKNVLKKKKNLVDDKQNLKSITAFSTAEKYDLINLSKALSKENVYLIKDLPEEIEDDVLSIKAKININNSQRDIFIFREGSIVCWDCSSEEIDNLLDFVKDYQESPYSEKFVTKEKEEIDYLITNDITKTKINNGIIYLKNNETDMNLNQYAFSNAIAMSVKLAIWESLLNDFVEKLKLITDDIKTGKKLKLTRNQVFKKTGGLYDLRHKINLSSDLLDTPDFYWDRVELEQLFQNTFYYLKLSKRTKVMNEKINHCLSLIELVSDHLNDKHHIRLEWMIIVLIMVEVVFEIIHYRERFNETEN